MKYVKRILQVIGIILMFPVLYFAAAFVLSHISVDEETEGQEKIHKIYLASNGVHLDVVLAKADMAEVLLNDLHQQDDDEFFSIGWGDRNFYINTPTWGDLTAKNAVKAMFLNSSTLIHITRYQTSHEHWIEVMVTQNQMDKLQGYIISSFQVDSIQKKIKLDGYTYGDSDNFYEAEGSYSCFKTCNGWVNIGLKKSDMKAALWTPFDTGVLRWYK
ncbi:MAG: DUF2459 domain-containing protein [Flavobacteriales bacterium]|nr:DUF2459 domain-containing protein [Flavobacteriales bacterium]